MLEAVLGAALAVGTSGPALAGGAPAAVVTTSPSLAPVPAPIVAPPALPLLLDLDRPDVKAPKPQATPAVPAPVTTPAQPPTRRYEVRPGDTLWALAAARLPANSSPQQITRGWQEWYLANHQQIGPDPGFLLVGETLLVPSVQS
jgi:Tfp pilus assembly protein FimV